MKRPTIATALFALCIHYAHAQSADCWLTTPDRTNLLTRQPQLTFTAPTGSDSSTIHIDPSLQYQSIDGFGFALTGGSAQHIFHMTSPVRDKLLNNLFGNNIRDINISYLRISIGASDLNDHVFSYDDLPTGASGLHTTLEELRKMPAEQLMEDAMKSGLRFSSIIDGYFLPQSARDIYSTGRQMDIPLLAGWNATEQIWPSLLGKEEPTVENYKAALQKLYGSRAEEVAKFYPAATNEEVLHAATDLASDRFLGYSTRRWIDLHSKTDGKPVYRYLYTRQQPPMKDATDQARTLPFPYAPHAAEIAYALGNLDVYNIYAWTPEDRRTSEIMQGFFINFIKTGNPNGPGLPTWSGFQASKPQVMLIDEKAHQEGEKNLKRYVFMDGLYHKF